MRKSLILLVILMPLAACSDRFRYACQDPVNANSTKCSCEQQTRTKNKALGALETNITTTTLKKILGLDC